jgi:hypothetical protein
MRLPRPTISHIPSGKGSGKYYITYWTSPFSQLRDCLVTWPLSRDLFFRWTHIQSPHGRALMLVPLILRCNANPTWFRSSYLEQVQPLLRPLDPSGLSSPVDLTVHACGVLADAIFAVSVPMHFQVIQLHEIVLQGQDAYMHVFSTIFPPYWRRTRSLGNRIWAFTFFLRYSRFFCPGSNL